MARAMGADRGTEQGEISVREAGRKGGETTSRTHGHEFYEEIGHKGGQRVRELIEKGEEAESAEEE